jgi:1,2-diacylglycerol 3-alpha-glucosyltransferase
MAITVTPIRALIPRERRHWQRRATELSPKRRMRVGIFTESYPPVVNGITTSVTTLVEQLERMGHTVHVFAPKFPGHSGDPSNVVRFPSWTTRYDPGYPLPVPFSRDLISAVARYKLDVIHSQSPFLLGLVALMVARAEHIPLVATNHTLYTEYSHYVPVVPEDITKTVTKSVVRWYYEKCDAVIAPSKMAADRLGDGYGIRRTIVKVVPTGIPLAPPISPEMKLEVRRRYGVPADAPMLLYAGRLAKEKNLWMLLEAFEKVVLPAHPEARLVLAGSGVDAEAIQHMVDESNLLRDRVRMTGFINRPDLDPIYAAADIFAFPSVTETQGVVLGEALAAGTPCCAVDAAGSPETVTDGVDGLLTANDRTAYGVALNRMLDDPEMRVMMSRNALRLAQQRTPQHMAQKIVAIYRAAQKRVNFRRSGGLLGAESMTPTAVLKRRIFSQPG